MDEFAEHGYGGARIDRIAKSAKLNNHALYYHFGDKEELFQAVLEHGYESLRANLEPRDLGAMEPEAGMAKIVGDVFEFIRRMPKHMAVAFDVNRNRGANLTPRCAQARTRRSTRSSSPTSPLCSSAGSARGASPTTSMPSTSTSASSRSAASTSPTPTPSPPASAATS